MTASVSITGSGSHSIACYDDSNSGLQSPIQTQSVQVDTVLATETFSGAAADTWLTNSQDQSVTVKTARNTKPKTSSTSGQGWESWA